MDLSSILGPLMAVGMIIAGMIAKGAANLIPQMISVPSFLIVIGGTFGALMVAYPMKDYVTCLKALSLFLKNSPVDPHQIMTEIIDLAQTARKESVLALEKKRSGITFAPLSAAVKLAVDGTDPLIIKDILEMEAHIHHEEAEVAVKFWEDYGAIAPTIGILGAVIGLMKVMTVLDQPEKIGPGIAVAFVATIYGVGIANILCIPIGKKLKRKATIEGRAHTMVIIGIEGILAGRNPSLISEQLKVFAGGHGEEEAH